MKTIWPLCTLLLALQVGSAEAPDGREEPVDLRSLVLLRFDCYSDLARREITLFGNGTLRLRQGPPEALKMDLVELAPAELDGYRARLAQENLEETESVGQVVQGEWIERCELEVDREDEARRSYAFARLDSLSLAVSHLVGIAEELDAVAVDRSRLGSIPKDYQPRFGDRLERKDGTVYRVMGLTQDKTGVELQGIDEPMTLYISVDNLASEFLRVLEEDS